MKNFFQRFPDLCCDIFDHLDDQNLAKSKEVSVSWCSFINTEKIWWKRMIQNYGDKDIHEDPAVWGKVIVRTPIEIVKKFAIASRKFYKCYEKGKNYSPLHIIATSGDLQLCMEILKKVDEKNQANSCEFTPLYLATQSGNYDVCKLIIDNRDVKNPANNNGFTPLYLAAQNGHIGICKLIIDNVDNKNPKNPGGFTPLCIAAQNGHFDICKLIIQNITDKNPQYSEEGETALHEFARLGHLEICELIIKTPEKRYPPC